MPQILTKIGSGLKCLLLNLHYGFTALIVGQIRWTVNLLHKKYHLNERFWHLQLLLCLLFHTIHFTLFALVTNLYHGLIIPDLLGMMHLHTVLNLNWIRPELRLFCLGIVITTFRICQIQVSLVHILYQTICMLLLHMVNILSGRWLKRKAVIIADSFDSVIFGRSQTLWQIRSMASIWYTLVTLLITGFNSNSYLMQLLGRAVFLEYISQTFNKPSGLYVYPFLGFISAERYIPTFTAALIVSAFVVRQIVVDTVLDKKKLLNFVQKKLFPQFSGLFNTFLSIDNPAERSGDDDSLYSCDDIEGTDRDDRQDLTAPDSKSSNSVNGVDSPAGKICRHFIQNFKQEEKNRLLVDLTSPRSKGQIRLRGFNQPKQLSPLDSNPSDFLHTFSGVDLTRGSSESENDDESVGYSTDEEERFVDLETSNEC